MFNNSENSTILKWTRAKKEMDAKDALFERLYGVKPGVFHKMLFILQKEFDVLHKKMGGGDISQTDARRQAVRHPNIFGNAGRRAAAWLNMAPAKARVIIERNTRKCRMFTSPKAVIMISRRIRAALEILLAARRRLTLILHTAG
ncbi:MAG: hypothetical protein LBK73_11025 [Treponema sp.]|nr:hypothetical protein [Treponema sp.]